MAPRARVPAADAVHARGRGRDARARAARQGDDDAGRRRDHGPPRSARHVRRPDPLDAGGARRGSRPRLRCQPRGGGRPRPRLLGDPRPVVPGTARRARLAGDHGRGRGAGGGDAHRQGSRRRPAASREPPRGLPRGTAVGRGDAPARGPARPVPPPRRDRVRTRRERRAGHEGLRDPGGDHVPRRRCCRVRRSRAAPARDRPRCDAQGEGCPREPRREPRDGESRRDARRAGRPRRDGVVGGRRPAGALSVGVEGRREDGGLRRHRRGARPDGGRGRER